MCPRTRRGRSFKNEYFGDNPELAEGFKDDNPLASSDNYEVYMKTRKTMRDLLPGAVLFPPLRMIWWNLPRDWTACVEVNKSDVVANTLSSVNTLVAICFDCDYHHPVWEYRSS